MTIPLFHRSVPLTAAILLTSAALASGCKSNSESGGAAGGTSGSSSTQSSSGRSGGSISSSSPGGDHSGGGNSSSSSKPDGSGGSSGTGGATGSCSSEADCGGDVFGTWEVTSSCLTVSGQLDLSGFLGTDCPSPQVTGSLEVTGTWSAKADNTFTDKTTTTGNEQFTLAAACLSYSGTTLDCDQVSFPLQGMGFASVSCQKAADGGCSCSAKVEQPGGLGVLSTDPSTSGKFTTAGNKITVDGASTYGYCVSAGKMTWSPQTQSPVVTGTVEFKSGGSGGTGGSTGGATSSGVKTGSGGVTGRGGTSSTGGSTGSSGRTATGGSTSSTGSTSTGVLDQLGWLHQHRWHDRHHPGPLRYLRRQRYTLRRCVQPGSTAFEQVQGAPVPNQDRGL